MGLAEARRVFGPTYDAIAEIHDPYRFSARPYAEDDGIEPALLTPLPDAEQNECTNPPAVYRPRCARAGVVLPGVAGLGNPEIGVGRGGCGDDRRPRRPPEHKKETRGMTGAVEERIRNTRSVRLAELPHKSATAKLVCATWGLVGATVLFVLAEIVLKVLGRP
jgi:hypothetical protein